VTQSGIDDAISSALAGRHLLDHPFYRSWQLGTLTSEDIGRYAAQYRHFEKSLPEILASTVAQIDDPRVRSLVQSNLDDELSTPSHLELFDRFASAVGATSDPPSQATTALVELYRQAAASSPHAALAVITAYESQAAAVAATKGSALRQHLGLSRDETEFWDLHADIEADHADWTVDALQRLEAPVESVEQWATSSADAWWRFLDEQERSVPA
jgi:pyrroloquinoline-quinone synthase